MRILLTSDWYPPVVNGVVTSVLTLTRQLEERGHEVRTLTLAPEARYSRDELGYRLASVGAGVIYSDARVGVPPRARIVDEVVAWGPDVVHSQAEFTTFAWARRVSEGSGAPLVHTYHTMYEDYTHYFSPSRRLGRACAAAFTRRVVARTDRVVAPTCKVADLLAGYRVDAPVHVVPTGIDTTALRPAVEDAGLARRRAELRAALRIRPDDLAAVYVGRLAKEKDLDAVLRLIAEHRGFRPRLVVVGDGPERAALEQLSHRLGLDESVTFVGAVPREAVADWYAVGDVFVSASRSETQGLTYAEALACGLPVLCRADPCLDDLVTDGRVGWQYTTDAEFHQRLDVLHASAELRRELSREARRTAVDQCSAQGFGARIEEVYELAVQAGPRGGPGAGGRRATGARSSLRGPRDLRGPREGGAAVGRPAVAGAR